MAFGSFDESAGSQPMAEINTTPLVDVMLVLLVIFIITAPLFHQAVPIDLPQVSATKLDDKPEVIQLAIDNDGKIFWNGEAIERNALDNRFAEAGSRQPELHLRADRKVAYEKVADVMAAAQRARIVKIAFLTQPSP
ncbi:MAG: biopolymer transporter ExbD [Rhodocyclales bacterium GT-UBC]|nr:MAG: biopolymer transporter ExbD [Rhodocyclales bacterium GT-UBC]